MSVRPLVSVLRLRQWVKNLLVFAPVFFSGQWRLDFLIRSLYAFLAFSLLAAAAYSLNDLVDRRFDRAHPEKQLRPIASGQVSPRAAAALGLILTGMAFSSAYATEPGLLPILGAYVGIHVAYTFRLKRVPIVEILALSILYVLRVVAGGSATGIKLSFWILTISWLLSFTVIVGRRYVELSRLGGIAAQTRPVLARYTPEYLQQLLTMGAAASVVCYLLWCHEKSETLRIGYIMILPSGIPVAWGLLHYLQRVLAGTFHEDPTKGILGDPQIIGAVLGFTAYWAVLTYAAQ